jgi:hypothetical protein
MWEQFVGTIRGNNPSEPQVMYVHKNEIYI